MQADEFTPWPESYRQHYRAMGLWQDQRLAGILRAGSEQTPDALAIIDGSRQWTYAQLQARAKALAVGLRALGLEAGDKVVVQMPNRGEFFEILFAVFSLGVVPVLALPAHRRFEIGNFIEITGAKAWFVCDTSGGFDYRELARECCANLGDCRVIIAGEALEFTALASLYQTGSIDYEVDPGGMALLQLSGGTTGVPKLIPRTHNDYFYSVRESVNVCEFNANTRYLAVLPVSHNFPLSSPGTLGTFYAGGTVILSESGAPDAAFPLIARHKVTHCALVPPLAIAWINSQQNRPCDLASLRVIQVGGAKLSAEAAQLFFQVFPCQLQQVFGMAEGLVNYTRLDDDRDVIIETQGRPMSSFDEVRVVDDDDQPVRTGQVGHLLTRGPYTIRGYYRAPAHNQRSFTADGFYRTGDLVRLTPKGYVVVEGRDKDQINRGGEKIAAEEVENQLLAHLAILDVAVVAMPDEYLGERICAFVITRNQTPPPGLRQARAFLKARGLADYKLPDRIEQVTAFPTTKVGKVNKKALRALLQNSIAKSRRINDEIKV